ncbi:MAG: HAMP domain-containing sensor histidine kinase [Desulfuromonadales bacterium]|nr:HAMP domain-containing sensor histidine kinase [Desulfuromonadales bacterium]
MTTLSDQELIRTLEERFEENHKALHDLRMTTSKLEEMNRKLQESEALKSHFLSNVRNEINNPLTAITGLAQQMICGNVSPAEVSGVATDIYFEAFNLDFQLQNVFAAAELEAGEATPFPARVDVIALVTSTFEMFGHQARIKQIDFRRHLDAAPKYFVTDPEKLRIILGNLLANAIEFSPAGASVDVRVTQGDNNLLLSVRNTGVHLDETARSLIFDRFRQLDMGSTKQHHGQGLGLSVCRSLAELLFGTITLTTDDTVPWCQFELSLAPFPTEVSDSAEDGNVFLFDNVEKF